jgi:hypothetical protein
MRAEEDEHTRVMATTREEGPIQTKIKEVMFDSSAETLYFEFERFEIVFSEFPYKTFESVNEVSFKPLSFEDPFTFMLSKYPISIQ